MGSTPRKINSTLLIDSERHWHRLKQANVFSLLHSSPKGLPGYEVERRQQQFGYNYLLQGHRKHPLLLFFSQFKDFMILVLVVAAVISGIAGDRTDTIIILVIIFLNAVVGFVQEYRAEKAMEALKKIVSPQATVLRDGHVQIINSTGVVPGDIVLLEAGNSVPADLRLLEVKGLKIMESSLTGESVAVDKITEVIEEEELPLGDRINMVYKGTQVTNGRGKGIVIATGMNTEIGKIAKMLEEGEVVTPLQRRMADFGKKLSYLILLICVLLFGVGLLRGEEPLQMLLVSISLAVAAIPEALPALITVALSRGAARLVKQHVLIRKLTAVETLGSVTYICTDKTGTLTQNKMTVVSVRSAATSSKPDGELSFLQLGMALNHTVLQHEAELIGDPTETAMVAYVQQEISKSRYEDMQQDFLRVEELPFDSGRKCMSTIHRYGENFLVITKGAVEAITHRLQDGAGTKSFLLEAERLAAEGMRVLAFGYRVMNSLPHRFTFADIESQLSFAGLVGMIDPPREEIKAAIAECKTAGIHPVMITGDHKETAAAIARQIGLMTGDEIVVTGAELGKMSMTELEEQVEKIRVYARVSPEQKLDIVKALQQRHHFVAMTGDGVNDAPSLKKANIGIAMGITGTDVTKEASHMILLDDNFATIVKAIKEGRRIYDNIRRFVKYIMTCNSAEILTIFLAPLLGLPIPLLPIHILWINLVTDGLPGLALSAEGAEKNIMHRPPRGTKESLFAEGIGLHIIWVGLLMAVLTLGTQAFAIHEGDRHWQTMVFTVLCLAQLAHVFAIRSDTEFIYNKGLFTNPLLFWAVLLTFFLQLGVIYLPFANRLFKTQPLSVSELLYCIFIAVLLFHAVELEKFIKKRRRRRTGRR
ncbi:MAG: cation-translocating P-type ATPase [Chitinophagaceae bacterium]|nr:MAG: cation-translocating P-type ATPase [Chitinophagaceae bacterium]